MLPPSHFDSSDLHNLFSIEIESEWRKLLRQISPRDYSAVHVPLFEMPAVHILNKNRELMIFAAKLFLH